MGGSVLCESDYILLDIEHRIMLSVAGNECGPHMMRGGCDETVVKFKLLTSDGSFIAARALRYPRRDIDY